MNKSSVLLTLSCLCGLAAPAENDWSQFSVPAIEVRQMPLSNMVAHLNDIMRKSYGAHLAPRILLATEPKDRPAEIDSYYFDANFSAQVISVAISNMPLAETVNILRDCMDASIESNGNTVTLSPRLHLRRDWRDPSLGTNEMSDIADIVFQRLFKDNKSGMMQTAKRICLSMGDSDVPVHILSRFQDMHPPVAQASKFRLGEDLRFQIEGYRRGTNRTVVVYAGYYANPLNSGWYTCTLVKEASGWRVITITQDGQL